MTGENYPARTGAANRWSEGKLLAAHRGGIKTVLIPDENKRDLEEIPDNVIADLDIQLRNESRKFWHFALQNEPFGMEVVTAK